MTPQEMATIRPRLLAFAAESSVAWLDSLCIRHRK